VPYRELAYLTELEIGDSFIVVVVGKFTARVRPWNEAWLAVNHQARLKD
jgi:hypothetical protein